MNMPDTAQSLGERKIQQVPEELKSLLALNIALKAARAGEAEGKFIAASLEIKTLTEPGADFY